MKKDKFFWGSNYKLKIIFCLFGITLIVSSCEKSKTNNALLQVTNNEYISSDISENNENNSVNFSFFDCELAEIIELLSEKYENNFDDISETKSFKEMLDFHGYFEKYNPKYYKNMLNIEKQAIYNSIIYMAEHTIPLVFFQSDLSSDEILQVLSCAILDYPSFESNIDYKILEFPDFLNDEKYICVYIANMSEEKLEKNLETSKVAEKIISDMPIYQNDYEKGEYLYKYLSDIEFNNDLVKNNTIYLYSALVEKNTNCDGFANATSLLFNMAGIECFKIAYNQYSIGEFKNSNDNFNTLNDISMFERNSGHAWNIAKIDGKYYHIDASSSAKIRQTTDVYTDYFYCISDTYLPIIDIALGKPVFIYNNLLPVCDTDIKNLPVLKPDNMQQVVDELLLSLKDMEYAFFFVNNEALETLNDALYKIISETNISRYGIVGFPNKDKNYLIYVR